MDKNWAAEDEAKLTEPLARKATAKAAEARAFKVGDRARVVRPNFSFDDYGIGDTATIADVDAVGVGVVWDCARFDADYERTGRCKYLYFDELERIP